MILSILAMKDSWKGMTFSAKLPWLKPNSSNGSCCTDLTKINCFEESYAIWCKASQRIQYVFPTPACAAQKTTSFSYIVRIRAFWRSFLHLILGTCNLNSVSTYSSVCFVPFTFLDFPLIGFIVYCYYYI
jgi:hypothetical protein